MKVIIDTFYNYDDDILTSNKCMTIIGGSWMQILYYDLLNIGVETVTAKEYLLNKEYSKEDLIISEGFTSNTKGLIRVNAMPFIIFSGESPNVDWRFYAFINHYTKKYRHAILFPGIKKNIKSKIIFHSFYWPNNLNKFIKTNDKRENLVMIVSNKKQNSTISKNKLHGVIKNIFLKVITNLIVSIRLKDLYDYRMKAIVFFSNKSYFKLYGKGWDKRDNLTALEKAAIVKLNPVTIDNKSLTLSKYNFAFCFENCIYPGYITEKIFDCFFAGCIPIYYGAPDVTNYIPKNTFIDARKFKDFSLMERFLIEITNDQIESYRKNIKKFLKSESFSKYKDKEFSNRIKMIIENQIHMTK